MIKTNIISSKGTPRGENFYHARSMALEFYSGFDRGKNHLVFAVGTLTMTIDPATHVVIGVDAYAPENSWENLELIMPNISGEGLLVIDAEFDLNGHAGFEGVVSIAFDRSRNTIKISLGSNPHQTTLIRFAENCVCEIGHDRSLTAIYLENLVVNDE